MLFNRVIEIVIRNFDTKEEFKVSSKDDFRIDFDYNEYLDQSSSSNTGTVKIYNLSIGTFQKIGSRFKTEVEIHCGYRNAQVDTVGKLCIGGLTSKSRVRDGADYITTLSFQTAIRELHTGNKLSLSYPPKSTLMYVIGEVCKAAGFPSFVFPITPDDVERYGKDIMERIHKINFPNGISFAGTPKQIFDQIAEMFSLGYSIDPRDNNYIIWCLQEKGFNRLQSIQDSLPNGNDVNAKMDIKDASGKALVLTIETGLIGSPYIETVEVSTAYGDALDENEELIKAKDPKVKRNKKGEVMKDKDGKVKMTKAGKNKKISRVTVNAKSLINPSIKPNSWIRLKNTANQVDGFYLVRNIKYAGSTHENNAFIMDMVLTYMKEANE